MTTAFALPDEVAHAYGLEDAHIEVLSGGRTNRTMRCRAGQDLVVQQLRSGPHVDLLGIMENLVRVTSHLDWKRRVEHAGDAWYPQLVATAAGKPFLMSDAGDVWRAFSYRPGQIVRTAQPPETTASIARLYGRFAGATNDLGGPPLIETTREFHDLEAVHAQLMADLAHADSDRAAFVQEQADVVEGLLVEVGKRAVDDGLADIAERVVHNDAKFSNVLLDRDGGTAIAVLDLDLVMMGPGWHDFGDLVRSACWHQPGADLPRCDIEQFRAIVSEYLAGADGTIGPAETATYAVAGPRLSLELGLRYLNDHLRDEPQLRVDGHNGHLRRGIANLKLAMEMIGAYDALRQIVDEDSSIGRRRSERSQ